MALSGLCRALFDGDLASKFKSQGLAVQRPEKKSDSRTLLVFLLT